MSTADVAGLWKRRTEEDPIGDTENADRDTLVLWTQSKQSGIYVDVRLPKDSPGRSIEAAKALGITPRPSALAAVVDDSETSALNYEKLLPHLEVLLGQKSFAGVLDVKEGDTSDGGQALEIDKTLQSLAQSNPKPILPLCTCFWRRDLDYQPPTGSLDIGVCASAASLDDQGELWLRETGADVCYAEDWFRPEETSKGPFMALELVVVDDGGNDTPIRAEYRYGYWVRAANCFAYAVGRPTAEDTPAGRIHSCIGKSLTEATQSLAGSDDRARWNMSVGAYVGLAGRINDKNEWIIEHALNPELLGCALVGSTELSCSRLVADQTEENQVVQIIPLPNGAPPVRRTWKVMELSDCDLPFD